jgi:hypothetical protein
MTITERAKTASHLYAEATEIFVQMMEQREQGASTEALRHMYQRWLEKRNEAAAVMHA